MNTMSAIALYTALVEAGASGTSAEQATESLPPFTGIKRDVAQIKRGIARIRGDIAEIRRGVARIRGDVAEIRRGVARIRGDVAEIRGDIAKIRENIAQLEVRLTWRVLGSLTVLLGIAIGVFRLTAG